MTCQTAVDMDNETPQQVRDTLPAELATVEGKHPGCHCWLSSELRSYATRTYKGRYSRRRVSVTAGRGDRRVGERRRAAPPGRAERVTGGQ